MLQKKQAKLVTDKLQVVTTLPSFWHTFYKYMWMNFAVSISGVTWHLEKVMDDLV